MKFLKIIFLFIIISSCSSDDNSVIANISPPNWIIGEWIGNDIPVNSQIFSKIIFTENNIHFTLANGESFWVSDYPGLDDDGVIRDNSSTNQYIVFGDFALEFLKNNDGTMNHLNWNYTKL